MTEQQRREITALLDQLTMPQLEMAVKFVELVADGMDADEAAVVSGITA